MGAAASRAFTVDTGAPGTMIESGPSGSTTDATPTFTFSASDSSATFECRVDETAFAVCSSPHTTSLLSIGSHTFQVRAIDSLGNIDATPASRAFRVVASSVPKAKVSVVSRSVTVTSARIAAVKLLCGPDARCRGTLTLSAWINGKLVGSRTRRVHLKLGSQSFALSPRRTQSVKVKLGTRSFTLLLHLKRLSAQAQASYSQRPSVRATATRTIALIAPKQPARR